MFQAHSNQNYKPSGIQQYLGVNRLNTEAALMYCVVELQ